MGQRSVRTRRKCWLEPGVSPASVPWRLRWRCVGVWLLAIGCGAEPAPNPPSEDVEPEPSELRVLFIGNSYTGTNDLPGMLSRIAATAGVPPTIEVEQVVEGAARLEEHWNRGIAQARIAERTWTHVVLQQQSIEPAADYYDLAPFDRSQFLEFAEPFGALISEAGATPVWFATWAMAAGGWFYQEFFDADPDALQDVLTAVYMKAAQRVPNSVLACVGEAFRSSLRLHPEIALHQSDASHPTIAGTYLAAATFYVALTGKPVARESELPAELSATDAAALREVAWSGSSCGQPRIRGLVRIVDLEWNFPWVYFKLPNTYGVNEKDFRIAGTPIARRIYLANAGETAVGLADGHTIEPPFSWTTGAYPGTSATGMNGIAPCADVLLPRSLCVISLSYSGAASGTTRMTLRMTDAYRDELTLALKGQTTEGALVWLERDGLATDTVAGIGLSPFRAGHIRVVAPVGGTLPVHVVVYNYGRESASMAAEALPPSWHWGMADDGEVFPGGSTSVVVNGVTYDYCTSELAPGGVCVLGLAFSPTQAGCSRFDVFRLAYTSTTNQGVRSMTFLACAQPASPTTSRFADPKDR